MTDWSPSRHAGTTTVADPYLFGDAETDRIRLETQSMLFSNYLRAQAPRILGSDVRRILDIGCGEGQLTTTLSSVYRSATVIGLDLDARAIAKAQRRALESSRGRVQFVVGDLVEGLPAGPFDLIYASMVLLHVRDYEKVLTQAYASLAPGGWLWIKDLHPAIELAVPHPAYRRAMGLTYATLEAIGAHPYLARDLPAQLRTFGFAEVQMELEEYPLGGATRGGQAALGILLGAIYNARQLVSRVQNVPESEIVQMYMEIGEFARGAATTVGTLQLANMLTRRPPV